jgi:hypothetical protein
MLRLLTYALGNDPPRRDMGCQEVVADAASLVPVREHQFPSVHDSPNHVAGGAPGYSQKLKSRTPSYPSFFYYTQ